MLQNGQHCQANRKKVWLKTIVPSYENVKIHTHFFHHNLHTCVLHVQRNEKPGKSIFIVGYNFHGMYM